MIISMTGFGRGEAAENGLNATVEIKTLNSRFLDVSIRLPQQLQDKELVLKELFQKSIKRGKLNVTVNVDLLEKKGPNIKVDTEKVQEYTRLLNDVRHAAEIDEPVSIKNVLSFGDVFVPEEEDEETIEKEWELVQIASKKALENLMQMRSQEGGQLKNDLVSRINSIGEIIEEIGKITIGRAEEVRNKLHERIQKLVEDENLDEDRLEMEVTIMADKMDITEEIVRMDAHLKFFLEAIEQPEPAGRRLNFLTQEINRELNTIGSKANDSDIAHYVVRAKEMLEQIREQVQNIE
ncbi:MAG: YicC family protein [Balneolales bacterium]|nr:YicC family protein [Balneolales bacterium]